MEGLVDVLGDLARVGDHERVLDDRQRDPGDIGLLEAVGADQVGAHLTGHEDGRHRIEVGVGDRGHQVGGAGAGGGKRDPDVAGSLGVPLGGVATSLLVPNLDVGDLGVIQRVVGGQVGASGNPEDVFDALSLEGLAKCVGGAHRI